MKTRYVVALALALVAATAVAAEMFAKKVNSTGLIRLLADDGGRLSGLHAARVVGVLGTTVNTTCDTNGENSASLTAGTLYRFQAGGDLSMKVGSGAALTDVPMSQGDVMYGYVAATGGSNSVVSCITSAGTAKLAATPMTAAE